MEEMDVIEVENPKKGFVEHVFTLDGDAKSYLLNVIQYCIMAILPIALLSRVNNSLFPINDDSKGNMELLAEVSGEFVFTLLGIYFIHRLITYVPSYSGQKFGKMNLFNSIMVYLLIVLNQESRLGSKVETLTSRLMELWNGTSSTEKGDSSAVNVIQPIVKPLPRPKSGKQEDVNFDVMYSGGAPGQEGMCANSRGGAPAQMYMRQENSPSDLLPDQQQQQQQQFPAFTEPSAANEALGGGFGTSF